MGFFRRYKLSDYTADECRTEMDAIKRKLIDNVRSSHFSTELKACSHKLMEEWACYRELLARHEGKNKSQLDT